MHKSKVKRAFVLSLIFTMIIFTGAAFAGSQLIVDTDVSWDDWLAIPYLVKKASQSSGDFQILGIVVNGCGEAHLTRGYQNVRRLVALAGAPSVPVYKGSMAPMSYSNAFPPDFRETIDNLYYVKIPDNPKPETTISGIEFMKNTLAKASLPVNILALGGLTDVATVLTDTPELADKIGTLFIMGGVFDLSGSVQQHPDGNILDFQPSYYPTNETAEWNIFIDPVAASIALKHVINIVIIPLNACRKTPLTADVVASIKKDTALSRFVYNVLSFKLVQAQSGGYQEYFYDPLSAIAAYGVPGIFTFKHSPVYIETKYNPEADRSGTCYFTDKGNPCAVAVSADDDRFLKELFGPLGAW